MIARSTLGRRFVGRENDLEYLLARQLDAARQRSRTVLVAGPAGIGKSRLLREMRAALAHRRARVVESACLSIARQPYAPIVDILAEIDPAAAASTRSAANRREQLDIVVDALLRFAERHTLVAIVEDLHWADAATLELLEFLTTRIARVRLLLVLSARIDERSSPRLARLGASDLVERLELAPLDPNACEAFIDDALAGRALAAAKRVHIVRVAEGNPYYLEELLKTTLERGEPAVPASLAAALLARTATLDANARAIVETAAVLGGDFDVATLCATCKAPRAAVVHALLAAGDLQIVEERGPDRFIFRHALTREALYGSIPAVRAVALHRAALDVYRGAGESSFERLAHHAWHTRDFAQAAQYAEAAGAAAMQSFAYEDAIAHFGRALSALDAVANAPVAQRVRVYDRRALAHIAAGSNAGAFADYVAAAQLLTATADREGEAEMRVNAAVQAYRNGDSEARTSLEAMLARLEPEEQAAATRLHVGLAHLNAVTYRTSEAIAHLARADRAIVAARPRVAYTFATATAMVHYLDGDLAAYERTFAAWLEAAQAIDGEPDVPLVHFNGAMYFSILGAHERSLSLFERGLTIAQERRDRMAESATYAMAAMAQLAVGDLSGVRRSVNAVYALATDSKIARAHAAAWGSVAAAHLGDTELLERCVDIAGLEPFAVPLCAPGYAHWLLRAGRAVEARALLHRATIALERPRGLFLALVAVARDGDRADLPIAREHLERAATAARAVVETPALALFDAYVARRAGRTGDVTRLAADAAAGFERLGYPLLEAQALEVAGRIDEAVIIYRRCGALGDLTRLGHAPASVSVLHAAEAENRPGTRLSAREREIAVLVAAGSTNRAIGERLNCSPKTVEKHLATIFRKVGIASRVQLTAWVVDGKLHDVETA